FTRSPHEPTLYVKKQGSDHLLLVSLYVDDMIYASSSSQLIMGFQASMKKMFDMTDLGELRQARWKIERVHQVGVLFLGMQQFHGAKKQATVAFSSTEAEYVAVSQLVKLFVMLARNPILHGRTKHIEIKHHYIKELIAKEEIRLETCRSDEQVANLLTKPLPKVKHE
ncbi:retrovirus-related pol polyprotein from transposon TNT 1-94, partial [Tanacetum coccineum]